MLATQNPIEMEGSCPPLEAQLDRLVLKLRVRYPALEELTGNTSSSSASIFSRSLDFLFARDSHWEVRTA